MADKKFYWLRLKRDFFKRHDIKIIESMPNGKDYILFYLKLLCESVDHDGNLRFSEQIPYNEQMLSIITDTNIDIVRTAIKIFSELGMMEVLDDGTYYMNEVSKLLGSSMQDDHTRESTRLRVQAYRERQKVAQIEDKRYSNVTCNGEIDIEKEIDIYKEKESKKKATAKRFAPPSVEEVRAYCLERNNGIDADTFVDFYTSKGWKVGNNPMKDWKAAVRTWEKRHGVTVTPTPQKKPDDGIMIYSIDEADENPPYYGLPKEWFDNEVLVRDRIKRIKQPAIKSRGLYEDVIYSEKEVYEKYLLRKEWFDERGGDV